MLKKGRLLLRRKGLILINYLFKIFNGLLFVGAILLTYKAGITNLNLYDESIIFGYGWLLNNNLVNGQDYIAPLPPMSGYIISAAFALLGKKYISAVYVTVSISAVLYLLISQKINSLMQYKTVSHVFSFLIVLSTLGSWGIPYYNALANAFICVIVIECISIARANELKLANTSMLVFMLVGMLLTKLNIGLYWILATSAYIAFLCLNKDFKIKNTKHSLVLVIFLLMSIFYVCMDYVAYLDVGFNYRYWLFRFLRSNLPIAINELVSFNFFFAVFYAYWLLKSKIITQSLRLLIVLLLLGHLFAYGLSGDARSVDVYLIILLAIFHCKFMIADEYNFALPILMVLAVGLISQSFFSSRKAYTEGFGELNHYHHLNYRNSKNSFFNGLLLIPEDAELIDEVLDNAEAEKKIFFGPGLELFYPVTNNFQPSKWPIWIHQGVSYNIKDHVKLRNLLINEKYEVLILSKFRQKLGFHDFFIEFANKDCSINFEGKYIIVYTCVRSK